MEKCTFCVQRIEDVKARAKLEGRKAEDGEIRTACAAACPAQAIVFGDLNDPESRLAKAWKNDRGYRILQAELGIEPSITYLAKLRNQAVEADHGKDDHHE
jgi:molybdopterin-containing oxidoreductase family iron-sulfur binding subunit